MEVLQINSVYGTGSTGRIVTDIAAELRQENIGSYVAYGRGAEVNDRNVLRIGTKWDNYIHGMITRIFDRHALWGSETATRKLVAWAERVDPDIIHLHNLHGYYLNVKILFDYLRRANKPVVWTLHDCWSFTGHCTHFSYIGCKKWQEDCFNCPQKRMYPASLLLDNSRENYWMKKQLFTQISNMTIVTPSKWLAELVEKSFLKKYPIQVIPNGVDVNIFRPIQETRIREKHNLKNKFIVLGVAAVWGERKGLNYFVELSKLLSDEFKVVLVGINEKQLAHLPSNIIPLKRTEDIHELAELYSAADVFVNLTLEDNFPTVNLEALACGTPVVTFNTGGSPEAVGNGCGYVAGTILDVKTFIDIIRVNGKSSYSKDCVQQVKHKFDKKNQFNKYVELYKALGG